MADPLVRLSAPMVSALAPANPPSALGSCGHEGFIGKSVPFLIAPLRLLTLRAVVPSLCASE